VSKERKKQAHKRFQYNEPILLKSDTYRRKCAEMVSALKIKHFGLVRKPESKPAPQPTPTSNTLYKVQVGAFSVKENADRLAAELKGKGYSTIVVKA
jgi:N-acetylmuramoyl-L-alanine amidase